MTADLPMIAGLWKGDGNGAKREQQGGSGKMKKQFANKLFLLAHHKQLYDGPKNEF